ncbi:hypothetical protein GCM10022223_47080 [Kineosporia mesophila]|uniref:Plasmid replication, integration and excision activator n=2 Tax=Kineosporia mesophila TaxID=566012 RepID=A0ABP7A468_9ACTN|nr:hypothetical protein [Kineosporia mesophila]MCD5353816.1 hypothetical protein [Kineosporia mesophila]
MALMGGYRFTVPMADAFPHGLYAMGVQQAMDYDQKTGRQTPSKDKQTGELVWTVTCIDRDPEAREKEVKIKVTAPHTPMLPEEVLPGSGLRAVEFTGLVVTPYIQEGRGNGRARMALSFRATAVHPQGKAPGTAAPTTGRGSRQASSEGDKAA